LEELKTAEAMFGNDVDAFQQSTAKLAEDWNGTARDIAGLSPFAKEAEAMADGSRDLIKQADHLYKLLSRVAESDKARDKTNGRGNPLKELDALRKAAVEQLKLPRYFWKHAHWLLERFPDAVLRDVRGLAKLVDKTEMANDWSLTPGRYVGNVPEEVDEDFDFEETLREIHIELKSLNTEAVELAEKIARNFDELGV
jgi:type I restriction enzyme M protein